MSDQKILAGRSFLVVDDDVSCVRMTTLILQGNGATVFNASNGAEAIQKAHDLQPDMVLADLLMPQMDGWTLVKNLKGDPALSHIPVIAVTASYLSVADIDHAMHVGFAKVVPKPLTISSLLEAISIVSAL
jgi:CheY-like chemotaxis protein